MPNGPGQLTILSLNSGLLDAGAVEITLIAQDLCAYGKDLSEKASLAKLLRALDQVADMNMNVQCGFVACMHILGASPKKSWISWDVKAHRAVSRYAASAHLRFDASADAPR